MSNLRIALRMSALLAFTLLFASGVQAQANRTWVSGVGDDSSPCSRTSPCKTLAGAIAKTNMGGEITMLDAGGFAPVIISKSITIDGTGVGASILAVERNAITIIIPFTPGHVGRDPRIVRIRGLALNGAGTGDTVISSFEPSLTVAII